MVCFVCLDNNVLRGFFAECGSVCLRGTKALSRCRQWGNWKIGGRLQMGDKSVATGVLNFAHASTGIIIIFIFCLCVRR